MIYMLWKECVPVKFYEFICGKQNFLYLNRKTVLHPKIAEIIWKFTEENINYNQLINNLS